MYYFNETFMVSGNEEHCFFFFWTTTIMSADSKRMTDEMTDEENKF